MTLKVSVLCWLVLVLTFLQVLSRTTDELEDSVDALEKEFLQKLKVVQDLKSEKEFLEKKIYNRKEGTKELARTREQLVQEKKEKERSIESLKFQLQVEDNSEVEELEIAFEKLSRTLEQTEIEYRNTLLHLEKLKVSVESDNEQRLLRVLETLSPCHLSLVPWLSNIFLLFRSLSNVCGEISSTVIKLFGIFIQAKNWLNFLEALLTLWVISIFVILNIICVRWCLKHLVNEVTIALGSGLLVVLVILDWLATLLKMDIFKVLLALKPVSWLTFSSLLLVFFDSLLKCSVSTSFTRRCTLFLKMVGRFTLFYSFTFSCGHIPGEIFAKISWTALLLMDIESVNLRHFVSLCQLFRTRVLSLATNDIRYLQRYFKSYWDGALYKRSF